MDIQLSGNASKLRARLAMIGDELLSLAFEGQAGADRLCQYSVPRTNDLAELARRAYAERRARERYLPASLFGDPGWDILLDLMIAAERGLDISVTSACIAGQVPATTALRWLQLLEAEGLVERVADATDGRRSFVRLTESGHARVAACLTHADTPEAELAPGEAAVAAAAADPAVQPSADSAGRHHS